MTDWKPTTKLQRDIVRLRKAGKAYIDIAAELDCGNDTVAVISRKAGLGGRMVRQSGGERKFESRKPTPEQDTEEIARDVEIERLKASEQRSTRLYKAAIKQRAATEEVAERAAESVKALPVLAPVSQPALAETSAKGSHSLVALVSDVHLGEVIDKDHMRGLSEYNSDIFVQRIGFWVDRILLLTSLRRSYMRVDELVCLMDGDLVSGIIHDELDRTNDLNIMDSAAFVAQMFAYAFAELSRHFDKIRISLTVGNHGRTKQKKEMKEKVVNWDHVAGQIMASHLKAYDNIDVDLPKSHFQITDVQDERILHFHGDGIRGWAGFPWYGADRAVKNLMAALQPFGESFSMVAMGHFHVPLEYLMPAGPLFVNGCWKGGDEFALAGLNTSNRPAQTLFYVHEEVGYVGKDLIWLDMATPEHAERFPDIRLKDVWSSADMPDVHTETGEA